MKNIELDQKNALGCRMQDKGCAIGLISTRRLGFQHRLPVIASLALLIAGCNTLEPDIKRVTIAGAGGGGPPRTGSAMDISAIMDFNGATMIHPGQGAILTLTRLGPINTEINRVLALQPAAYQLTPCTTTISAADSAALFPQRSRWKATASVEYQYAWTSRTKSLAQEFMVSEPANIFDFLDANPLTGSESNTGSHQGGNAGHFENWTISQYNTFRPPFGAETILSQWPLFKQYAAENFSQAQENDFAVGFDIDLPSNAHPWNVNTDQWSVILSAPSNATGWTRFNVQVRASAAVTLQSYVRVPDGMGGTKVVFLKASKDNRYWGNDLSISAADTWQTCYFDTVGSDLPVGSVVHDIKLEFFASVGGLEAARGKHVLIDHVVCE